MARAKKNGTYLNVCIENSIYEQLNEICADAGQTKTIVVERALNSYFCDYREKQKNLRNWGENRITAFERGYYHETHSEGRKNRSDV